MVRSAALALVLLLSVACAATSTQRSGRTAVASVYPLTWLVEEIAPAFDVTPLAAPGVEPHDLELTPQQRAAVEQSDIAVYLGNIGFQPQVDAAVGSAGGAVVSAADVIGEDNLRTFPAGAEEPGIDPHMWFDARLFAPVAQAVGDAAAAADPARAEEYRANGARVAGELRQLASEIDDLLSRCRFRDVIVSHEAYQYLLAAHDLAQQGISGAGGRSEASPQDIARLAGQIRELGLPAVLSEPVEGRADAEAVAAEAGVDVIPIYSLDIVDEAQARKGYPALLREQAQAVAAAAGCNR